MGRFRFGNGQPHAPPRDQALILDQPYDSSQAFPALWRPDTPVKNRWRRAKLGINRRAYHLLFS